MTVGMTTGPAAAEAGIFLDSYQPRSGLMIRLFHTYGLRWANVNASVAVRALIFIYYGFAVHHGNGFRRAYGDAILTAFALIRIYNCRHNSPF
jgi:hypothetical protein